MRDSCDVIGRMPPGNLLGTSGDKSILYDSSVPVGTVYCDTEEAKGTARKGICCWLPPCCLEIQWGSCTQHTHWLTGLRVRTVQSRCNYCVLAAFSPYFTYPVAALVANRRHVAAPGSELGIERAALRWAAGAL